MPLTEIEQFTLDVLSRNDYLVSVDYVDEDTLRVSYAEKLVTEYTKIVEDFCGLSYRNSSAQTEEVIYLSYHLLRLYVLLDIYRQCRRLSLPYSAVWFFRDNVRSDLLELWPLNLGEVEVTLEKRYNHYVGELLGGESLGKFDTELEQDGYLHEFTLLKGLLV